MSTFKVKLRQGLSLMFKELTVDSARDVSPHFKRLRLTAPWLRSANVAPGDKLQIMILESGPRTYSPFGFDAASGSLELLAYVHGDTAAATWVRGAGPGTRCRVFGPRGSLPLAELRGPVVLFGDETSLGVARSLQLARGAADGVSFVFECTHPDETAAAAADVGLHAPVVVQREPGRAHLEAVVRALLDAAAPPAGAQLVLTGHAQTIQALRARLKAEPIAYAGQKVKAYWADGKRGLD